jgi:hypothetical protein
MFGTENSLLGLVGCVTLKLVSSEFNGRRRR